MCWCWRREMFGYEPNGSRKRRLWSTSLQVRIAAYSSAESQGIGLPWDSLRDMGWFLFTKLLNLLCLLLCQYYFSGDVFLVSPTITWLRSLCGSYRWSLRREFRVSAGWAPLIVRWGCRHVSHATHTLFISNQSSAGELKTMHYAGLLSSVRRLLQYIFISKRKQHASKPGKRRRHTPPPSQKKHAHNLIKNHTLRHNWCHNVRR